jgi:SAM-dependent methyltransferase
MATDNITDQAFWLDYWKDFVAVPIAYKPWYADLLADFPGAGSTFLEVGGFPGNVSAYVAKARGYDVTVLDFMVLDGPIRSVESANELPKGSIKTIKIDFFSFRPDHGFDVVLSAGFIEHFKDTKEVIAKHIECLKPGGSLFIGLPNLRGITGWWMKHVDRKTYDAHNISCMNISFLHDVCDELGLKSVNVFYHGRPVVWLDHPEQVSLLFRAIISLTNKVIRRLPWKGRWWSPQIVIIAKR